MVGTLIKRKFGKKFKFFHSFSFFSRLRFPPCPPVRYYTGYFIIDISEVAGFRQLLQLDIVLINVLSFLYDVPDHVLLQFFVGFWVEVIRDGFHQFLSHKISFVTGGPLLLRSYLL